MADGSLTPAGSTLAKLGFVLDVANSKKEVWREYEKYEGTSHLGGRVWQEVVFYKDAACAVCRVMSDDDGSRMYLDETGMLAKEPTSADPAWLLDGGIVIGEMFVGPELASAIAGRLYEMKKGI